jgi:hypothetical protein
MLTLSRLADLESANLPPPVAQAARQELRTLLALSGGDTIDSEFGYVLVLADADTPAGVTALLQRPIEGAVRRHGCFVVYFAGGGNEHLPCAVLPEALLTEEHRQRLLLELTEGGAP